MLDAHAGDVNKAVEYLLSLDQSLRDPHSVIGKAVERETEEQMRAFQRECRRVPERVVSSLKLSKIIQPVPSSLPEDSTVVRTKQLIAEAERDLGRREQDHARDSERDLEAQEYLSIQAKLEAIAARTEEIRDRMNSPDSQGEIRVSESYLDDMVDDMEFSIIEATPTGFDQSLEEWSAKLEHEITEPPLITICYQSGESSDLGPQQREEIQKIKVYHSITVSNLSFRTIYYR